jgi:predicted PurR-regulated permease PerM
MWVLELGCAQTLEQGKLPWMASDHRSDIVFTVALLLALWVAWLVRSVLLLIYVSVLFAVVLGPALEQVQRIRLGRWHPGRGLAMALLFVLGLAAIALFFTFALPPIFHDVQGLARDWPARVGSLLERARHLPLVSRLDIADLQQHLTRAMGGAVGLFKGIAGGIFGFLSWVILTAYFIVDGERTFRWAMSLVSPRHRPRLESTLLRAEQRMRNWLIGQAGLMLILGVAATAVFGLLRIKYFYALGVLAGLANIVPIVGPIVSVILACVVAAVDSWGKVAGVLIFYFVYQQVENAFLTPRIMKQTVDLPPLAVIIALAIGGMLAGVLGALIAVPTAALVAALVDEYLVHHDQPSPAYEAVALPDERA